MNVNVCKFFTYIFELERDLSYAYAERHALLRALKTLYFHFCNSIKEINCKCFCKQFCKILGRKIVLGTSDTWWTSRLSHRPSKTVYYIVDRRISELHHGSSEFLELDIFPAYSMQFDSTYPNLA